MAKKAFLFAKIAERRGWLNVLDPGAWEVSADNVLMRLALRSGLVSPGPLGDVRTATRAAFKELAARTKISPPVLDDMLWELGATTPTSWEPRRAIWPSLRAIRRVPGTRGPAQDVESVDGGRSAKKKNQTAIATRATTSEPTSSGSSGPRMVRGSSSSGASSISRMRRGIVTRM